MTITEATNQQEWDTFLCTQQYRPFLQSWAMGEVYKRIGQEPVRLIVKNGEQIVGICFAHVVPARRGRHLSVPYGPVMKVENGKWKMESEFKELLQSLKKIALENQCSFIRMSPFWAASAESDDTFRSIGAKSSPLHLLAEHLWLLPLENRSPEDLFKDMRSTTRNLIRRAEKEGVTVEASSDPILDLPLFMTLHEETRKRHRFTPYTDAFFQAQVEEFRKNGNVTLYLARYQGEVIAASIHMHFGGETSYHHGASTDWFRNIPASYLLQWSAIQDALKRGDHVYNFWGIAPEGAKRHPFAGVTLFKTGFGGQLLELTHCRDIPLSPMYHVTRGIEMVRKWRRGF